MPRKQPLKREKTARISPMVTNAKEQKDMSAEVPASGMSTQGSVVHESTNGRAQAEKKEDARRVTRYPIPDPCQIRASSGYTSYHRVSFVREVRLTRLIRSL